MKKNELVNFKIYSVLKNRQLHKQKTPQILLEMARDFINLIKGTPTANITWWNMNIFPLQLWTSMPITTFTQHGTGNLSKDRETREKKKI